MYRAASTALGQPCAGDKGPCTKPYKLRGGLHGSPTDSDPKVTTQDGLNLQIPNYKWVMSLACSFLDKGQSSP